MSKTSTIVITGGASGIGMATAMQVLRSGFDVAVLDRDSAALKRAETALVQTGGNFTCCEVDICSEAEVANAIEHVANDLAPISGLVNSAGIALDKPAMQTVPDELLRIYEINVVGAFIVSRAVMPHLVATSGAIVNVASVSGIIGNSGRVAYGASKAAIIQLTRVMASELAPQGVRINSVAPGPVETPLVQTVHTTTSRSAWRSAVPMGRYARPEEIASVIHFLLSAEASFITGEVIAVDGGFLARGLVADGQDNSPGHT